MTRYSPGGEQLVRTPTSMVGGQWDARHLTNFLSQSHYSNWKNDGSEKRSSSNFARRAPVGDYFFRTVREDKNSSRIGFTPIFPLVNNSPIVMSLDPVLHGGDSGNAQTISNADGFRFTSSTNKFRQTDPITMHYEASRKPIHQQRFRRLIQFRHPHGLTGIDHSESKDPKYYSVYDEKRTVRQEPNQHTTFLIDREWKTKMRSHAPTDLWKNRETYQVRKFRNDNLHGYNILTNRQK